MVKRYSNKVVIEVTYEGSDSRDLSRELYKVSVTTPNGDKWQGTIGANLRELKGAVDSSDSYDAIAKSALSFASQDEDTVEKYGRDWLDSEARMSFDGYRVTRTRKR
jgi:hypothetical protein